MGGVNLEGSVNQGRFLRVQLMLTLHTSKKIVQSTMIVVVFSFASAVLTTEIALAQSGVSINGYSLNANERAGLERYLGMAVPPGHYALNTYTGCWMNLSTGASGCPSNSYVGAGGSGERNASGDWSYYSNTAGFGVGGTGDGCLYAGDWSNC